MYRTSKTDNRLTRRARVAAFAATLPLAACNGVVMKPSGDIANQQADLIVTSTMLMLLIIVPVLLLTLFFAWRYRASNRAATYDPDWDHSTKLELIIWGAPLLIIIALGAVTWISTHKLDPFRPIERLDAQRPLPANVETLEVQVVAMDWKWLFVYPQHGIATLNELAAPVDRPISFKLTSQSVMNAFYVPALAGMIYAMPGMQSMLHAVINKPGVYDGFSANFSGDGFSHMRFKFHGLSEADFERWVAEAKSQANLLDRAGYLALEKPSEREPVRRYARVEEGLYDAIVNRCVDRNRMCMNQMMAIDASGGLGPLNIGGIGRERWGNGERRYVAAALCTPENPFGSPLVAAVTAEPVDGASRAP